MKKGGRRFQHTLRYRKAHDFGKHLCNKKRHLQSRCPLRLEDAYTKTGEESEIKSELEEVMVKSDEAFVKTVEEPTTEREEMVEEPAVEENIARKRKGQDATEKEK